MDAMREGQGLIHHKGLQKSLRRAKASYHGIIRKVTERTNIFRADARERFNKDSHQ